MPCFPARTSFLTGLSAPDYALLTRSFCLGHAFLILHSFFFSSELRATSNSSRIKKAGFHIDVINYGRMNFPFSFSFLSLVRHTVYMFVWIVNVFQVWYRIPHSLPPPPPPPSPWDKLLRACSLLNSVLLPACSLSCLDASALPLAHLIWGDGRSRWNVIANYSKEFSCD